MTVPFAQELQPPQIQGHPGALCTHRLPWQLQLEPCMLLAQTHPPQLLQRVTHNFEGIGIVAGSLCWNMNDQFFLGLSPI